MLIYDIMNTSVERSDSLDNNTSYSSRTRTSSNELAPYFGTFLIQRQRSKYGNDLLFNNDGGSLRYEWSPY
jgi:hypothetical protein